MVDELLEFKEKLDQFLLEYFHNNEKFSNTLKDSFEHFLNQRSNKPAELIGQCLFLSYGSSEFVLFYFSQSRWRKIAHWK